LIIEDDAVFRRGLARIFSAEEFEVTQVSDGEQALTLISHHPLDLIICDFRLPGINGVEVLSHAQQIKPRTPFLLLTAYYSEELMKEATAQGAVAVLEKPIELKLLRKRCTEILMTAGR
jgi:CheY-like chemotaxis protein